MSKQQLDISQMQHLKELGVDTSKASMWWCRIIRPACPPTKKEKVMVDWFLSLRKEVMHTGLDVVETIPTFTLQDVLDLLPKDIAKGETYYSLVIDYQEDKISYSYTDRYSSYYIKYIDIEDDLIDAAYEMLCWCIEQGYIDTNK